jgi:predicted outer membrane repeat protein
VTVSGGAFTRNSAGTGGGLLNLGSASVSGSAFTGNSATTDFGGGLYNAGTATVSGSSFTRNSAKRDGGGIFNSGTLLTPLQDPNTFAGNTPDDVGGQQLRRRHR